MSNHLKFYINGAWVEPATPRALDVINPANEEAFTQISIGSKTDVDRAVAAAKAAFPKFSQTSKAERIALLKRIIENYKARFEDIAQAVSAEMGAPIGMARDSQAAAGLAHIESTLKALEAFEFEDSRNGTRIVREGIGVVGLITPWNWPLNQIACKVAPAIAAGCTMVLKPSEIAPITGVIFSEIMHAAGTPAGVYNMLNGDGPSVGQHMSAHPDIDMVSFTGSTRAGILVAQAAAPTVKRVAQELGGKSPNLILPDADLSRAIPAAVAAGMRNVGQSCSAPTRIIVPRERLAEVERLACEAASALVVGDPRSPQTTHGPVANRAQFDRVQDMIGVGIAEGARLVCGGVGRPQGLERGYYVRPTLFSDVRPQMRIAQEEIFGPVLVIIPYDSVDEAVEIANGTVYGLGAHVQGQDLAAARAVAARIRSGQVHINNPPWSPHAPFGGYKRSGNGREYGVEGLEEYLETKAILGYLEAPAAGAA
jgi:aldehyde dehydrogenase (NAD+)